MCVGHHHIQTHINNVNKACAFLQTTGGKYIIIKHTNYISPDEHTGDISIKNHSECVFSLSKLKQQNIWFNFYLKCFTNIKSIHKWMVII
jgi:hypothetical protein